MHAHGQELQSLREELIETLNEKAERFGLGITIVFDAMHQPDASTRSHFRSVEIIFTARRESADHYLLRIIEEAEFPSAITLVSSDRDLAWKARLKGAHTLSVENFLCMVKEGRHSHRGLKPKQKIQSPPPSPKRALPKLKQEAEPSSQSLADPELEKYRQAFEERLAQEKPIPIKPSNAVPKDQSKQRRPKVRRKDSSPGESDFERWRRLFEERFSDSEN